MVRDCLENDYEFHYKFIIQTTGSSTLPRPTSKSTEADLIRPDKPITAASTTSLYDNVASGNQGQNQQGENHSALNGSCVNTFLIALNLVL